MTLGKKLRAAIERKKKSQAWVAQEVGITPASLSAILTGKTADASFFTVLAIARVLDEPLSAIVDDPLTIWTSEELARLGDFGGWLVERSTREGSGVPLEIPPRRNYGTATKVLPVAATPGVGVYPEASEVPRQRIPAEFPHANAIFSVMGESMTGVDIFPGDRLYVRLTPDPREALNQVVVCAVDDMILVKRIRARGRQLVLESANPKFKPLAVDEDSSRFRLIGIVVGKRPSRGRK
ncbi:MAG TPA: LexA family transcriptional regulator [Thermoanaerobaculia bacterium]|nr:LexA family transcriptional regulator [Thermoanaerobaculia bacterium]